MTTNDEYVVAALDRMIELLEQGWCQHKEARRDDGVGSSPLAYDAASWCLVGASRRTLHELELSGMSVAQGYDGQNSVEQRIYRAVLAQLPQLAVEVLRVTDGPLAAIAHFNDDPSTSREDVLLLVKRAREAVAS